VHHVELGEQLNSYATWRAQADVAALNFVAGLAQAGAERPRWTQALRDAIRHDPDKLTAILHEVVALSEADRDTLAQLLSETTLTAIIKSANLIASRQKFLGGGGRLFRYRIALAFLPMTILMILASLLAGRWASAAAQRWLIAGGCLLFGAGLLLTNAWLGPEPPYFTAPVAATIRSRWRPGPAWRARPGNRCHPGAGGEDYPRARLAPRRPAPRWSTTLARWLRCTPRWIVRVCGRGRLRPKAHAAGSHKGRGGAPRVRRRSLPCA
jgi:hypothetical protein